MNENELTRELVTFYKQSGIPEAKIPAHMDMLMCRILQEIYKDREGYYVLHAGEHVERFDVGKLRASLELAADNGGLQLTHSDINQLSQLTLEKIHAMKRKLIHSRNLRILVLRAIRELGFTELARAYQLTRPFHERDEEEMICAY